MFKKINELSTDPKKEKEGVRIDVEVELADKTTLKGWMRIRRAGGNNLMFAQIATALRKPHKYQFDNDTISPAKKDELNRYLYADACLADFGGFPAEDGTEVPYSEANGRALLSEYSVLYDMVQTEANASANYRQNAHNEAAEMGKGELPGN